MASANGGEGSRLGTGTLLAYGGPAVALQVMMVPLLVTLPPFYAQDVGLSLGAISLAFGIARIWEAISDPLIGAMSDRTRSRFGRRAIWMIGGTPLAVAGAWFLLHPPAGAGTPYLIVWLILFYLGWTMVYIPYQSWGAELATGFTERSRIAGFREAGSFMGYLMATLVPMTFLVWLGGIAIPTYGQTAQTIGLFFMVALPVFVAFCVAKVPRREILSGSHIGWSEMFRLLGRNKPFVRLLIAYVFDRLGMGVYFALFPFLLQYALGVLQSFLLLSVVIAVASLGFVPLWVSVARRVGKHRAYCFANIITMLGYAGLYFAPVGGVGYLIVVYAVLGLGNSGTMVLPGSMTADAVDYDELRSGAQQAGAHMAFLAFVMKIGLAGGALGLFAASAIGFNMTAGVHTPESIQGLRFAVAWLPVVLVIPAILLMWNFPLDARRHSSIRRRLERRSARARRLEAAAAQPA
jgi:GPH family glycoside/pentoside/hexuronide:cation symporter